MSKNVYDLHEYSAVKLREALRKRLITCSELLASVKQRFDELNPVLNAIPTQCFDRAQDLAAKIDEARNKGKYRETVLGGLPICIKDLTAVAGLRSTWGTVGLSDFIPLQNDPIVDRLEASGAIVIGKSNTPEMGAGNVTYNEVFGATRNPWDTNKNPGGSSGGSAAAVSAGIVPLGHGTDLAGSLRNPAAYCGIVSLRPTPGRAGGPPQSALFNTETVHGPIARSVTDVALLLDAMVGFDPRIPISIEKPGYSFLEYVRSDTMRPLKLAYSSTLQGFARVEGGIATVLDSALKKLSEPSLILDTCEPELPYLYEIYTVLRSILWATGPGSQPQEIQRHYKATLRRNIEAAHELNIEQIYRALTLRTKLYNAMLTFFEKYDCLLCPVIGKQPGTIDEEYPKEIAGVQINDYVEWLRFSFLAPATSLPSMAIPVGLDEDGMPVGIQLIGKPRGEAELLLIANRLEKCFGFHCGPINLNVSKSHRSSCPDVSD